MNYLDEQEVKKHINILNVAYHLCLEIVEQVGYEYKAICPFCGYNKNSKVPTLSLNIETNKYCCSRCGAGGYSIGLYARMKKITNQEAYKELLDRECYSQNKVAVEISPINLLADIQLRDRVYRDLLDMLKLENQHKNYLRKIGLLDSSIEDNLYRTVPKNYIKRRLISHILSKKYDLAGIPGMFQEEDFKWCFNRYNGFFVPVFNEEGLIQGLSIHLDKPFNNSEDIWFSSNNKINGTATKNYIMKSNISADTTDVILTDNFILGHLIKDALNLPVISFQNISNSYMILKEIENTNIKNITFVVRIPNCNNNLDYIINRIFRDLLPLGYNLDTKCITNYNDIFKIDFFDNNFNVDYTLKNVA